MSPLLKTLSLIALGLSGYLSWASFSDGVPLAGCGAESDCDAVLASRWSLWLGVPVAYLAVLTYAEIFVATLFMGPKRSTRCRLVAWNVFTALVFLAGGAAVWFIAVQAMILKTFCPVCMSVHVCGLALLGMVIWQIKNSRYGVTIGQSDEQFTFSSTRIVGLGALAAVCVALLIGGQVLAGDQAIQHRLIEYEGIEIDVVSLPMVGSPKAEHVLVEFFDYTCSSCRAMHGCVEQARQRYGEKVAVAFVPVPGDAACNPKVRITHPKRRGACEYAKLSLAVWRLNPAQFEGFHNWLNQGDKAPPTVEAHRYAAELAGDQQLKDALSAVEDDKLISAYLQLNEQVSLKAKEHGEVHSNRIPKLLIGSGAVMIGLPKSQQVLFEEIERALSIQSLKR